jgi:hypothetical protein
MRFRALIVAVVLAAGAALGGWVGTTINVGAPLADVQLFGDAGSFIVTGANQAEYDSCDSAGQCMQLAVLGMPGLIGASINSSNCMWGVVKSTALVTGNAGCNYGGNLVGGTAQHLRCLPSGFCAALVLSGGTTPDVSMTPTPTAGTMWLPVQGLLGGGPLLPALSVVELNNVTYTLSVAQGRSLYLSLDGGLSPVLATPILNQSVDGKLFLRRDGTIGVIYTRPTVPFEFFGSDLTVGSLTDAGWVAPTVAPVIEGLGFVAYTESGGSSAGFGFGMATQRDGGALMASPMPNPASPGLYWTPRTGQTPGGGVLALDCWDPTFCVAISSGATEVWVYWNAAPPDVDAGIVWPAMGTVQEGITVAVTAVTADSDGDPVFVSWPFDGGGMYSVVPDAGDQTGASAYVTFAATPDGACSQLLKIQAVASDGYGPHDRVITGGTTYQRTTPDPPSFVSVPSAVAPGAAVSLVADGGACGNLTWSLIGGPGSLMPNGNTALYTAPASSCAPDAGATIKLSSTAPGTSTPTTLTATIQITPTADVPEILGVLPAIPGAGPVTLYADGGACSGTFTWLLLGDAGTLIPNGPTAQFTAPSAWCAMDAGQVVQLTSMIAGGMSSSTTALIPIMPKPDAPAIIGAHDVQAGDGTLTLGADAGMCAGTLTWGFDGDAGVFMSNGSTATFTPPTVLCQADGGSVTFFLNSMLGSSTASVQQTIHIAPWGAPYVPLFVPSNTVSQPAGTDAGYPLAMMGNHACQGSMGFPGVTVVSIDGGANGLIFAPTSTGIGVSSTDICALGTFGVQVQTEVAGEVSPYGNFLVTLTDNAPPLTTATSMFQINVMGTNPLNGLFTANVPCPNRHALTEHLDVVSDAGVIASMDVPQMLGPWTLPVPGLCRGGNFSVNGTLFDDGGVVGTDNEPLSLPAADVGIANLNPTTLDVTCDGLSQDVHVDSTGICSLDNAFVTWTQTGGLAVSLSKVSSSIEHLSSMQSGLDGLVGETISLQVVADNGNGQTSTTSGAITLQHAFVEVGHDMTPAASNADELATVQVRVHNKDPCGAQNIVLHEQPDGLQFVAGSGRVDRDPIAATLNGAELDIGPFALAAGESHVITWLARVPLLGTPKPTGSAWIKAADVGIQQAKPPPQPGCGCDSSPSAALLLLGLFSLSTRRRALSPLRTSRRSA